MRMRMLSITVAATGLIVIAGACKRQDDTQQPASAPAAPYYGQAPGYPAPQPQGAYGQVPAPYPTATYGAPPAAPPPAQPPSPAPAPTVATAPAPPAPTGAGQMAVPGPVAFQCQNDLPCGTHHCNVQYGKCAFPCQTNVDCIAPNTCVMGLCVPAPPAQH